ncbi:hypothetical protein ACIBCS_41170 [Streptomyces phaeochromogenes]
MLLQTGGTELVDRADLTDNPQAVSVVEECWSFQGSRPRVASSSRAAV